MDNTNTRWRKLPVEIDAFCMTTAMYNGEQDWPDWAQKACDDGIITMMGMDNIACCISTLEGRHDCSFGDWIIRGVKGELYPCKPDIFAATYEAATETDADPRQQSDDVVTRGPWATGEQPISVPQHIAEMLMGQVNGDDDGDSLPERRRAAALGLAVQASEESAPHSVTDGVILNRARAFEAYLRGDEAQG